MSYRLPDKTSVYSKHHLFSVMIAPGKKYHFKSEYKLKQSLITLNKELTEILHEVVWILKEIRLEYYHIWFLLDDNDHFSLRDIKQSFNTIESKLELITRPNLGRDNISIWFDFEKIFSNMGSINKDLYRICFEKRRYERQWNLKILQNRLDDLKERFSHLTLE